MAFIQCGFFAETLGFQVQINVFLPQTTQGQIGIDGKKKTLKKPPVMYLLHGLSDDHSIWGRFTSVERYAGNRGLAVVMPCVHRSFYRNVTPYARYWDYISQELPENIEKFFNVSTKREDTFAAGLSMGGFGAFKLALNCPERFAAAASLSGAFESTWFEKGCPEEFKITFGSRKALKGTADDLKFQAKKLAESGRKMPKLYQACGTEDFLHPVNKEYRDMFKKLGYDLTYSERPGTHEWGYWDSEIKKVIEWLPVKK